MSRNNVEEITKENILKLSKLFSSHPRYGIADRIINKIVNENKENNSLDKVLLKVSLINSLYSTVIFDIIGLSEYISKISGLDPLIALGSTEAVDKIRAWESPEGEKERDVYSFATKFCSFHKPDSYPIFDNLIAKELYLLNKKLSLMKKITHKNLRDYNIFKQFVDAFHNKYGFSNYKEFDQGLWLYAKYRNIKENDEDNWITENVGKIIGK